MSDLDLLFKLELDMEEVLNILRCWHLRLIGVNNGMCYDLFCDFCPARIFCRLWIKAVVLSVIKPWDALFNRIGLGEPVALDLRWEEAIEERPEGK